MGGLNVKNTIVEQMLEIVAPHPCYGCGKIGSILCEYCKYDIEIEPFAGCVLCGGVADEGVCERHTSPFEAIYTTATRQGVVKQIIDSYKFSHNKSAARVLADLLHATLPLLPADTVIVPVPTVTNHIRRRGYDHVGLLARHLSRLRGVPILPVVVRKNKTVQHTAPTTTIRRVQAQQAFRLNGEYCLQGRPVLLLDDIITTGSTLTSAGQLLCSAGAIVYGAVLAYQPLD